MSLPTRTRLVNPKLGQYYGIIVSAFAALVLVVLVLEQLGVSDQRLRLLMLLGPPVLFLAIGLAAPANELQDYFACGRRVPSVINGLVISVTASGSVGLLAFAGTIFHIGFDALCLAVGWMAGLVVMAVLIVPFLRKFGGYTLPGYLGRRFASPAVRLLSAVILSVPLILLVQAELHVATRLASWLINPGEIWLRGGILLIVVATVVMGGMRSLTWSSAAMAMCALLALLVPVAIYSALETYLPLPQFSQGPMLRSLLRLELATGAPAARVSSLAFSLPPDGLVPLTKRFIAPFSTIGDLGFILMSFTLMAGVATSPILLARSGTTLGVYESRKSLGWGVFILGAIFLTLVAVAIFMRDIVIQDVLTPGRDRLPEWFQMLMGAGLAHADTGSAHWTQESIAIRRDAVLLALPIAAGFPAVGVYSVIAGALAVATASIGAGLVALGNIWSEDVMAALHPEPPEDGARMLASRLAMLAAAVLTGLAATVASADPLELALWAFALLGSSMFPVLVMSIWWKRVSRLGVIVSIATGFTVATLAILAGQMTWFGLHSALAGVFGIPAAIASAIAVSLATASPKRAELELVRDIRVPGGETVYDREMRLWRLKKRREP